MKPFLSPIAKCREANSSESSFRRIKRTGYTIRVGDRIRLSLFLVVLCNLIFLHVGLAQAQDLGIGHSNVTCRFFLTGHKLKSGEAQLPESTQKLLIQVLVALKEKWEAINDLGVNYRSQYSHLKSGDPEVFFELALLDTFTKIAGQVDEIERNEAEVRNMEASLSGMAEVQGAGERANSLQLISMFRDESNTWVDSVRRYWDTILDRLIQLENTWHSDVNQDLAFIEISMQDPNSDPFVVLLKNMYLNFAQKKKWKTQVISTSETIHKSSSSRSSQGLSNVVIKVEGPGVFRALEWESGFHRLMATMGELRGATVKKGNEEKITTVNVLVTVLPGYFDPSQAVADTTRFTDEEFSIEPLKKSSGPGGQNVNKTESAVRVTHIRTGTKVVISEHRSQHQNKEVALRILRAKVKQMEEMQKELARQQRRREVAKLENTGAKVSFARSYKRKIGFVNDTRMEGTVEPQSIDGVLNGYLDPFVAGGRYLSIERILKKLLLRISDQVENAEKRCREFGVDGCR
ncbi:MAG: PCRF domain-containing protein [Bdellovibrionales bacterium]|nr:PCRF domain-containing protein [Bdellovibrionales bacterium]